MTWWMWVIIGLVGIIALYLIVHFTNRAFRRRYGFSLYGGAVLMLIVIGCCVGGFFLNKNNTDKQMGMTLLVIFLFAIAAFVLLFILIYDFKRCGGAGILALLLQILFCVPALLGVIDLLFNKGQNTFNSRNYRATRRRNREREDDYRRYRDRY